MKKTYAAPMPVASGDVVRETKITGSLPEQGQVEQAVGAGSVGFHL